MLARPASTLLDSERRSRDAWLSRRLADLTPEERALLLPSSRCSTSWPSSDGGRHLACYPPRSPDDTSSLLRTTGMFRSLRVRNYRLYASGQLVSLTGTWMQRVAQDWLVLELTNSGTALGIVTALQFGPSLVFGLWGGVLADRGDKRKLLLATQTGARARRPDAGRARRRRVVQYWHVLVLATALGLVSAVDSPVRQSFVVEMVGQRRSDQCRRHQLDDLQLRPHPRPGGRRRDDHRGRHRLGVRRATRHRASPC